MGGPRMRVLLSLLSNLLSVLSFACPGTSRVSVVAHRATGASSRSEFKLILGDLVLIEIQEVLARSTMLTIKLPGESFHCGILADDFTDLLAVQGDLRGDGSAKNLLLDIAKPSR